MKDYQFLRPAPRYDVEPAYRKHLVFFNIVLGIEVGKHYVIEKDYPFSDLSHPTVLSPCNEIRWFSFGESGGKALCDWQLIEWFLGQIIISQK